jgi:hypothetical protein
MRLHIPNWLILTLLWLIVFMIASFFTGVLLGIFLTGVLMLAYFRQSYWRL